jgi:putative ABC transport system permease protein
MMKQRLLQLFESLATDLRYALRGLRREPVYAVTAILTLALGLGAVTAMLAVVDSVLLRPIPLAHADRLVVLQHLQDGKPNGFFSFAQLDVLAKAAPGLESLARVVTMPRVATTADGARMAEEVETTPNLFAVLGAKLTMGRAFTAADGARAVVVNDAFWRERMRADPQVLGSTIKVSGRLMQVVGVLPRTFAYPQAYAPVVFVPMVIDAQGNEGSGFDGSDALALLRHGVTVNVAQQQVAAAFKSQLPQPAALGQSAAVRSYRATVVGDEQPALVALMGACFLLLAIACANAANLQIVRAAARTAEISLRSALGASRTRILQKMIAESVTVSLLGGALGLLLAYALVAWTRHAYGANFPRFNELRIDPWAALVSVALAVATGLLAAIAPGLIALRVANAARPVESGRALTRSRASGALVAAQLALTCVLLVTAGLFIRTFSALEQVPLGFDPHGLTNVVLMGQNQATSGAADKELYTRLVQDLGALPGVQGATTQTTLPFSHFQFTLMTSFRIPGHVVSPRAQLGVSMVTAGYSHVMHMPILQGRGLSSEDHEGMPLAGVVNEAFVRTYLHGNEAVGQQIDFTNQSPADKGPPFLSQPLTIVGVAQDEVDGPVIGPTGPTVFIDYRQFPATSEMAPMLFGFAPQFAVRSHLPQASLERAVRAVLRRDAPEMAEMGITSVEQALETSLSQRQLALRLAAAFGAVALLLAAVGIYGVLAYSVAQRKREIGIRMALGSSRAGAMRLVARQAAGMVLAGLALGFAGSWPAGKAISSFLFGVQVVDAPTWIASAAVLLAVCAVAAAAPAWRAAQVDPMEALRME